MAYTKAKIKKVFAYIIDEIEKGRALRIILKDPDTPSSSTFFEWLEGDEEKAKRYARATRVRADDIFDEILEIADTTKEGVTIKETHLGTEVTTGDMLGHRKLQIDARKWYLAKLEPSKYGDKVEHDVNVKVEQPFFPDAGGDDIK